MVAPHALASRAAAALIIAALAGTAAPPAPALGAEAPCEGDECQGPPPGPEETIPATAVVQGPANPPVRFPKSASKPPRKHPDKKKHRHHARHHGGRR